MNSKIMLRKFRFGLLVTAITFLFGCDDDEVSTSRWPSVKSMEAFETTIPEKAEYSREYRFHSVLMGFNSTSLSFFESGRVDKIYVSEGEAVSKGTLLATLYSPNLSEELAQANAELEKQRVLLKLSKDELYRSERLFKERVIAQQDMDKVRRDFDVNTYQTNVSEAKVSKIKNDIENLKIYANENGMVSALFRREGDYLNAGEALLRFESTDRQKVIFEVPEKIALTVNMGEASKLFVPAMDKIIEVVAIERSVPTRNKRPLHKLTFEVKESISSLVGLRSTLILHTDQQLAYKVDYRTIRYEHSGKPYVIEVGKELRKIPVELIDLNARSVIVNGGINQDDRLLAGSDTTVPLNLFKF